MEDGLCLDHHGIKKRGANQRMRDRRFRQVIASACSRPDSSAIRRLPLVWRDNHVTPHSTPSVTPAQARPSSWEQRRLPD